MYGAMHEQQARTRTVDERVLQIQIDRRSLELQVKQLLGTIDKRHTRPLSSTIYQRFYFKS